MLNCRALVLGGGVALALIDAASAQQVSRRPRNDHEGARQAYQQGKIRSLGNLLIGLRPQLEGEVIEVDLKREDSIYIYELKILTPTGRVIEMDVNAATGERMTSGQQ